MVKLDNLRHVTRQGLLKRNPIPVGDRKIAREIITTLRQIQTGTYRRHEGDFVILDVLTRRGYITEVWKQVPYIDRPSKMARVFDKWAITTEGRRFLDGLSAIEMKKGGRFVDKIFNLRRSRR